MKLTGAQIVFECLRREGVRDVFGYPGGSNLPLYDTFIQYPDIRHILVRHEQAAAHAADSYARVHEDVGVCFATSGPGATNLVTGIANAFMDSVPVVCITGSVVTSLIGRDGFQEADITGITLPVTKHNTLVLKAADIAPALKEAFHIARTGRPGPVLVDIPRDVQQEVVEFEYPETVELRGYKLPPPPDAHLVHRAAELINESQKPLILAGHGVIISKAYDELRYLAETAEIPVVTTLLGISGFPGSHELSMGMPGMHGMYWNNMAISDADLLIACGMRFDDRVTGRLKDFAPNAKILHIDIDPAEIGKNVRPTVAINSDVRDALGLINKEVKPAKHSEWTGWIRQMRDEHPSIALPETDKLLPQYVISRLYNVTGGDCYVCTGVGQHQMWAAQYFSYDKPNSWVTSGGLGTMGFELPGALGMQAAKPGELVWTVCGDGGFQMTLQELGTLVEYKLPVKMAILNNGYLGMVRQWQDMFYEGNKSFVRMLQPDFVKLAEAYGIMAMRITDKADVDEAIRKANAHDGPVLLEFVVTEDENCFPMVPPGASLQETVDQPPMLNRDTQAVKN